MVATAGVVKGGSVFRGGAFRPNSPNITYPTSLGKNPSWSTVKSRYWKTMNNGNVPKGTARVRMRGTGEIKTINVSKELHHINGRTGLNPHRFSNLREVWPC